jgi:O-antigen/teichoic acid export membrane protein
MTYAYFSAASHSLSASEYGGIALLWAAVFTTVNVAYRPVEQYLSRTIAERRARGHGGGRHLRIAARIQVALVALFLLVALLARDALEDGLFGGSRMLYVVFLVAVCAYAASYFARGYLAGNRRFAYYGGLMLLESTSRFLFALVVLVGLASGQSVVAYGIAAAPIVSLVVIPAALSSRLTRMRDRPTVSEGAELTVAGGIGFVVPVLVVMLCEQAFLNAGPIVVKATAESAGTALAGFTFNVLLITRAPLQLFQAVQTSILPHLTGLQARGETESFRRSVTVTIRATTAFAGLVVVVLLLAGPRIMEALFGSGFDYSRLGLAAVGLGMGCYLAAATLNQAALAAGRAREAAVCWAIAATAFVVSVVFPGFDDPVLQVEVGYLFGAALLCSLLYGLYRRAHAAGLGPADLPTTMS